MNRRRLIAMVSYGIGCVGLLGISSSGHGQDSLRSSTKSMVDMSREFRIDVDLYTDETRPPISQFKTLFTKSRTIEIDDTNGAILVVHHDRDSLSLIDFRRRVQSEITASTVEHILNETLAKMDEKQKASNEPLAKPSVDSQGVLVLKSTSMEYRVQLKHPEYPEIAVRYSEFADWSAKIAAVFPPYKPPQLRMALNRYLIDERLLPVEISRSILTGKNNQRVSARMLCRPNIGPDDQKEVMRVLQYLNDFPIIGQSEYFSLK